jgi:hypothetical protein
MFFKDHDVTGIARLRRRQQLSRVEKRMLTPFGGGKAPTQLTWLRERKKGGDEQQESLVVRHSAKCSSLPQLVPAVRTCTVLAVESLVTGFHFLVCFSR